MVCFSPLRASAKELSGLSSRFTDSSIVISESFGIRYHFFRSSANTAHTACCCSRNLSTISKAESQRVGSSWISLCSGSCNSFCFFFNCRIIFGDLVKADTVFLNLITQTLGNGQVEIVPKTWNPSIMLVKCLLIIGSIVCGDGSHVVYVHLP